MCAAALGVNGADVTAEGTNDMAATTGTAGTELASFGLGCFWCGEAVFEQLDGVVAVRSGYQGGHVADPSYEQVCTGNTGHAEVIQVEFDPAKVTYDSLLDLFWRAHDPTQLNRQGNDVGTQYRSVIFTYGEAQQQAAEASKRVQTAAGNFDKPIVTEIVEAPPFYVAEADHQDFYGNNREYPYCRLVIAPKLKKLGMKP